MRDNAEILATRMEAFNKREGARVGDFLLLSPTDSRCPDITRFTYHWGDHIQTGGHTRGSYYLGDGYMSYSGCLDPGIAISDLIPTGETRMGKVWFFDGDWAGAGRGVDFDAPMRVFRPRPGANLEGIGELRCHWHLSVLNEECHKRTCGYWFCLSHHAISQVAFATEPELMAWLAKNRLKLTSPVLDENGQKIVGGQMLAFA